MIEPPARPHSAALVGTPLAGRHAIVTGASRGIGAAVADSLARLGADITLIGRDRAALEARGGTIASAHGVRTMALAADVTDAARVDSAIAEAGRSLGSPTILVNNAGAAKSAPFLKTGPELWQEMIAVNLAGAYHCSRAVLPAMLVAGWGRIVNVASTAGLKGYAYVTAYVAAKHGVVGLTRALALEVAKKGVTVNAVCPGYTETEIIHETVVTIVAKTGRSQEEALAELAAANPQGRLVQPWEVAETVAFLCLPSSGAINGAALAIAGGEVG